MLAAILLCLPCAAAPSVSAQSAILIDGLTGEVLFAEHEDQKSLIASTTKIMTALVILENKNLDETVTIPTEAVGIEGSSLYLEAGDKLTIRELLYGMMLHSGNDAAVALALLCSGSVEAFADLMNEKAAELGLANTHFVNPSGLDGEDHYSTAKDLAIMTAYAMKNPEFVQIVSTKTITIGERRLKNHNRLLWTLEGAIGVKTGYTKAAGRILVSAASRNNRCLIAVTIHDGNDWKDHSALYEWAFCRYEPYEVFRSGECVCSIELADGSRVQLIAEEAFSFSLTEGERLEVKPLYPKVAISSGAYGTPAGVGGVYLNETLVGTMKLLWGEKEAEP